MFLNFLFTSILSASTYILTKNSRFYAKYTKTLLLFYQKLATIIITWTNKRRSSVFSGSNYIRYLSSSLDKNPHRSQWEKANHYFYFLATLTVLIIFPYFLEINIFNYLQGLFFLISLQILIHYIPSSYLVYNTELSVIGIVAGYIDGLISSIVEQSLIPDYLNCILLFIGLFMLLYSLTLENKSSLSIWSRIKQVWNNKGILLLIILGFFFLNITLIYFGILLIIKDSFILFTLTVFARIVFFKLTIIFINYCFTKNINSDLFSLNIFTVLFIVGIVYSNVFIFFPIIHSTFYVWYNGLYPNMENLCMNLKDNLKISIRSCEKHFSSFIKWLDNCTVPILDIYKNLSSYFTFYILGIDYYGSRSLDRFAQFNKSLVCILQSNWNNFTWDKLTSNNFKDGLTRLINYYTGETMTMGGEECSSKVIDLQKDKEIVMKMNNPEQGSSSGKNSNNNDTNNHNNKRKILTSQDIEDNSNLDETREERKKRLKNARNKRYRENNPEKVAESQKKYIENNPEKVTESQKKYRDNNPEKVAESKKRYRENNPNYNGEYYQNNKDKWLERKLNMTEQEKLEKAKKDKESLTIRKGKVAEKNTQDYLNYLDEMARGNKDQERLKELSQLPLKSGLKKNLPVWLVDSKNKKIGPYVNGEEAAIDLGILRSSVSRGLSSNYTVTCKKETGNIHTKFGEKYNIKKVNKFDKELSREDVMRIANATMKGMKTLAIDSKGNEKEFTSKSAVSRKYGITRVTLDMRIKDGKSWRGYTFKNK